MTAVLPSDTHAVLDPGHTIDHNNLVDCLAAITGASPGGAVTVQQSMNTLAGGVTGGRFLRGNGTNVILDKIKLSDISGLIAASARFSPANPATTTSTTQVMMGLGAAGGGQALLYTPIGSGVVVVTVTAVGVFTAGAAGGLLIGGRYGLVSGGVPANGAAVTGTAFGPSGDQMIRISSVSATTGTPVTVTDRVSGLTLNSQYWVDLAIASPVGTTTAGVVAVVAVFEEQLS